jgi:hypothetical protein
VVNLLMSLFVRPRVYTGFLAEPRFGETSLSAVSGARSVVTALAIASLFLAVIHHKRLPELRKTLDAAASASVLPAWSSRDQRPLYGPVVETLCLRPLPVCEPRGGYGAARTYHLSWFRGCRMTADSRRATA